MGKDRALRNAFWRELGAGSFALVLGAVFSTFASLGFLVDILTLGRFSIGQLIYTTLVAGGVSSLYVWCATRGLKWLPAAIGVQIALLLLSPVLFPDPGPLTDPDALRRRLTLDGVGIIVCIAAGYTLFISFILREGVSTVSLRTEMSLAREIHQSLVPPVSPSIAGYEVCGVSIPSGAVGGDLVDFIEIGDGTWLGYVADVSGHGVPAGLLMGMVKSATRTRLLSPASLAALLDDLNKIVFDVKRPNMFVTFAAVLGGPDRPLELALAGHLPLLLVRRGARTVEELSVPGIPLGVIERHPFESRVFDCEPGDLLALVTDGLTEVFDRRDREFGLDGLEQALVHLAGQPLPDIRDALLARVAAHGPRMDDQTLLLMRRTAV
jgi:serine phosphatase RsbU (regulator of sigma subunit)